MSTAAFAADEAQGSWPSSDLESVSACPVCGGRRRRTLYDGLPDGVFHCAPGEWTVHACEACGSAFLDPRPTPQSIGRAYSEYYTHDEGKGALAGVRESVGRFAGIKTRLRNGYLSDRYGVSLGAGLPGAGWIVPLLFPLHARIFDSWARHLRLPRAGGRLLDLGAGNGAFVRSAAAIGWRAEGMDPDRAAVEAAGRVGLIMREGSLPDTGLESCAYDAVTLNHVIEHVHEPRAAFAEVYRILKPGGWLWIATPNIASPLSRRMRASWRGLEVPRHLVIFNHASLARACREAHFVSLRMPSPAPITEWILCASLKIAAGIPSSQALGRSLTRGERARCRWLKMVSLVWNRWGEEIVLVARKPQTSSRARP